MGLKDMDEFNAKCPLPKPPGKLTKDGWVANENDPTYQQVIAGVGQEAAGLHRDPLAGTQRNRVGHA